MKIRVNWPLCDGNGACALEAPNFFELDANDQLRVIKDNVDKSAETEVQAAVRACPKHALSLTEG